MHIKSFIIGLVLLAIGSGTLWWTITERRSQERDAENFKEKYKSETSEYNKRFEEWMLLSPEERASRSKGLDINANKSPEQVRKEQEERLIADLDKLSAGEMTVYPFADDFYGPGWQTKIEQYKKQKEKREFIYNCSIAIASIGGLLAGWMLLIGIARVQIGIVTRLKKMIISRKNKQEQEEDAEESDREQGEKDSEDSEDNEDIKDAKDNKEKKEESQQENKFGNLSNVLVNSGWQYAGSFGDDQKTVVRQRKRIPAKYRPQNENSTTNNEQKNQTKTEAAGKEVNSLQKHGESKTKNSENKTESETIINNNVDFTNTKGNAHIDNTLKDLTQQVSAIREYAATQQNRLERFQDGYDWNIIKTFCLRIIRCIDNIENRIMQLSEEDSQMSHLEEVRDELVFALESSGIEQFEPEVNSEYRGQEKFAEALKEKTECDDPDKKGKIEKVVKPGYQFYIDEENVKIVRPAQVRLFA